MKRWFFPSGQSRGILVVLAVALAAAVSTSRAIEVTSKDGKALDITVMTVRGNQVQFKRTSDGRVFSLALDSFAPESAEAIRKAAGESAAAAPVFPALRIDPSIGRRLDRDAQASYMRHERVTGTFTITNLDNKIGLGKCKLTFLYYGRNPFLKDNYQILAREEKTLALDPGASAKIETKTFVTSFDEDRNGSNLGGYRYEGHVCIVQDEATGKLVTAKSSTGHVDKRLNADPLATVEQLLKLQASETVTKDLQARDRDFSE